MSTQAERDARYRKRRKQKRFTRALSEGDSWFDYPMYPNLIDIIDESADLAVARHEICGDVVSNMIGTFPEWRGVQNLVEIALEEHPSLVLFSGGGNDMVGTGDIEGMIAPFNAGAPLEYYLATARWRDKLGQLGDAFAVLAAHLGSIAPVFAHGYDYIVPAWKPVHYDGINIRVGPWVIREMEHVGIRDQALQRAIGTLMIDKFNEMLAELAVTARGMLVHVDLRGVLDPDADWENEIHPTQRGFEKLAAEFVKQLQAKRPEVIAARVALGLPVVS
jgi:hypothetical protein